MSCNYSIIFKDSDETSIEKIFDLLLESGIPGEKMKICPPDRTAIYVIGSYRCDSLKVCSEEIMYIANAKRGSTMYVRNGAIRKEFGDSLASRAKIRDLYPNLSVYDFVQIHNSYIVNMNYIKYCSKKEIELMDGTVLTVARSKEREFRETFEAFFRRKHNIMT